MPTEKKSAILHMGMRVDTVTAGQGYPSSTTATTKNQLASCAGCYDASGNMLSDHLHTYTYDAENRLSTVDGQTSYLYDAEGNRVTTKVNGAITAEYLYDLNNQLVTTLTLHGDLIRTTLDAGGEHWGDYQGSTVGGATEFRLGDLVGTLTANFHEDGTLAENCFSGPFGEGLTCDQGVDFSETHFTNKKRDQESNLDYFGARYYSSTPGRWMSPDKPFADQHVANPQSWNMYSYTRNNPITSIDPDGQAVKVLSSLALQRIQSTLPANIRSQVTVGSNGMLDQKAITNIKSDDSNVQALQTLVAAPKIVEVGTADKAAGYSFEYKSEAAVKKEVTAAGADPSGVNGPNLYLGYTQSTATSSDGNIQVTVSDGTGAAATVPESQMAVTTAHELYGHALLEVQGKPHDHDNGGPVDKRIQQIEEYTQSLHKQIQPQ